MRYTYECIEQLDLSGNQLKNGSPNYSRFSLMLTDNIVELMLHRQCEDEIRTDDMFSGRYHIPKYSKAMRDLDLSKYFEDKVKFCKKIKRISDDEQDIIVIAHKYRNQLYHVGLKYEDIIYSLAYHYYQLACKLFRRFGLLSYYWSSSDSVSDIVKCHVKDDLASPLDYNTMIDRVVDSLLSVPPILKEPIYETLSNSALDKVKEIEDGLDYLTECHPRGFSKSEILEEIQFYYSLSNNDPDIKIDCSKFENCFEVSQEMERVRKAWSPKHKKNPISRWRERAIGIRNERTPISVLKKYENLINDMSYLQEAVGEAVYYLDQQIQTEIDRMRGK
jgi:hypothetical protein